MRRVLAASFVVSSVLGCAFSPPEGALHCDPSTACPPSFVCRADRLCWRTPDGVDASPDARATDGGADAGMADASDAFGLDAFGIDAFGIDAATDGAPTIDAAYPDAACVAPACEPGTVVEVVAGYTHTCVLLGDGRVQCFGGDDEGELGDGTPGGNRYMPMDVVGLPASRAVHADAQGNRTTCVVTDDQHVWCWGWRIAGSIGDGTLGTAGEGDPQPTPAMVLSLTDAIAIAGSCAWNSAGVAHCWGGRALGTGSAAPQAAPTDPVGGVARPLLVQYVTHGAEFACALTTTGGLARCWGVNHNLAVDPALALDMDVLSPRDGVPATMVRALATHVCILSGSEVICWGDNVHGESGADPGVAATSVTASATSVLVRATGAPLDATHVLALGGNAYASCALMDDHGVLCWGSNVSGYAGWGASGPLVDHQAHPVVLPDDRPLTGVVQITSAGHDHVCVLRDDGHVLCWGNNTAAQLGTPTTTPSYFAATDIGWYPL
jgi:alpha-tubulin suppressor-like RCC1 family protein